jgi:hypothetical protein
MRLGEKEVQAISKVYKRRMKTGGVLLIQPEHIPSFQLMGIESIVSGQHQISRSPLDMQHFSDNFSQEFVDESDENFSSVCVTVKPKFPHVLLATQDFARTIKLQYAKELGADAFQRPAQWILSSTSGDLEVNHIVVISPFEAQHLMLDIKKSLESTPSSLRTTAQPRLPVFGRIGENC